MATGNRKLAEKQLAMNRERLAKAELAHQDKKILDALKSVIALLEKRLADDK